MKLSTKAAALRKEPHMFSPYFTLETLFCLKILKFLSWFFGHVNKKAWLERKFMTSQPGNKQLQCTYCLISQEVKAIR